MWAGRKKEENVAWDVRLADPLTTIAQLKRLFSGGRDLELTFFQEWHLHTPVVLEIYISRFLLSLLTLFYFGSVTFLIEGF